MSAMEDAHTTIPEYKNTGASFFAVFDGHGGKINEEEKKAILSLSLSLSVLYTDMCAPVFLFIRLGCRQVQR